MSGAQGESKPGLKDRLTDGLYGLGWGAVKKLPEPVAQALFRTLADQVWKRRGKSVLRLESNLARVRAWDSRSSNRSPGPTTPRRRRIRTSRAGV